MLTNFFVSHVGGINLKGTWSQQDGSTCPIALLYNRFHGHAVSCKNDHNWPVRSYDLKPLGFLFSVCQVNVLCQQTTRNPNHERRYLTLYH